MIGYFKQVVGVYISDLKECIDHKDEEELTRVKDSLLHTPGNFPNVCPKTRATAAVMTLFSLLFIGMISINKDVIEQSLIELGLIEDFNESMKWKIINLAMDLVSHDDKLEFKKGE